MCGGGYFPPNQYEYEVVDCGMHGGVQGKEWQAYRQQRLQSHKMTRWERIKSILMRRDDGDQTRAV